jgi:hypothetical protein
VFAAPGDQEGTALQRAVYPAGPRGVGGVSSWSAPDHDAPTEAFGDFGGAGYGGFAPPYGAQSRFGAGVASPAAQGADMRILLGILCVLGGLISGAGALALALAPH